MKIRKVLKFSALAGLGVAALNRHRGMCEEIRSQGSLLRHQSNTLLRLGRAVEEAKYPIVVSHWDPSRLYATESNVPSPPSTPWTQPSRVADAAVRRSVHGGFPDAEPRLTLQQRYDRGEALAPGDIEQLMAIDTDTVDGEGDGPVMPPFLTEAERNVKKFNVQSRGGLPRHDQIVDAQALVLDGARRIQEVGPFPKLNPIGRLPSPLDD
jgi:hypothetical protein